MEALVRRVGATAVLRYAHTDAHALARRLDVLEDSNQPCAMIERTLIIRLCMNTTQRLTRDEAGRIILESLPGYIRVNPSPRIDWSVAFASAWYSLGLLLN